MQHQTSYIRCLCLFLFVVVTVNMAGCGRSVGSISGKVTYKGNALKGGNVAFHSTEGLPSVAAMIAEDGTYTIETITAGSYKVCVDTDSLKPPQNSTAVYGSGGGVKPKAATVAKMDKMAADFTPPEGYTPSNPAEGALAKNAKRYTAIPDKYRTSESTDLTRTVTAGSQTYDIDLK